ncbi:hypothetical protein TUM4438_34210 [Shewanella sairae]|uniref:N-acetyltransferase domain-containing protein n=1 Tax=Shewanella sairae TaxID=190310 RepID=A0ABQ4PND4_9GAMM|nr:GNAT family N-acetyltransferase [Shewanella sairae]MCL1130248.1 GNAT family N-acetyltransferase [Shewanella sairae]GIU49798.1 hypothetical protein TUM4438_34210 [Shewanella sairae]
MNLRKAVKEDLPKLLELEQRVIEAERPYNDSIKPKSAIYYDIENLISSNDSHLVVGEIENEIIASGYVQIRCSKRSLEHDLHGYLGFMYVSPSHRGKGINSAVIEQLIEWGKHKGVQHFYLDVYSQNNSAMRAYEKLGFTPTLLEMQLKAK